MGKRNFSFRVKVPWYRWRWRLALVVPMLFLGHCAWSLVKGTAEAKPQTVGTWLVLMLILAIPVGGLWLCLRWTWQQRFPYRNEATAEEIAAEERETP
jgi:hypothetical protein